VDDTAAKLAGPNRNRIRFGPSSAVPVGPVLIGRFGLPLTSRSRPISSSSSSARLRFSARNGTNPPPLPTPVAVALPALVIVELVLAVATVLEITDDDGRVFVVVDEMVGVGAAAMGLTADVGSALCETRDSRRVSSGSEDCSSSSP